jgi:hypothetical protein
MKNVVSKTDAQNAKIDAMQQPTHILYQNNNSIGRLMLSAETIANRIENDPGSTCSL